MSVILTRMGVIHENANRKVTTPYTTRAVVAACGTVLLEDALKFAARPEQFPQNPRWCTLCAAIHFHTPPQKERKPH